MYCEHLQIAGYFAFLSGLVTTGAGIVSANGMVVRGGGLLLAVSVPTRRRPESWEAAARFGPEMLAMLEKKLGVPQDGWTHRNVLIATARRGGFLARNHDGGRAGKRSGAADSD